MDHTPSSDSPMYQERPWHKVTQSKMSEYIQSHGDLNAHFIKTDPIGINQGMVEEKLAS